jgi:amino acid adenylation domain-containing protein
LQNSGEVQQLAAWNAATQQDYPRDMCVPQLVAMQAAVTPDAVALFACGQMLSYRELNQRANQLARYLQTLGVGPNVLVGLCAERSLDMVVGLLGILKAGGAYLPLDPNYPTERLSFMLVDAHAHVLVTQRALARLATQGTQLVCLDTDASIIARQSVVDPLSEVAIDDLAYVIYTSGSTGRPKGVQITHESLLNLVFWHQRAFAITCSDRATQLTSPAFDATGWEVWPYLTIGASVHLPDDETRALPTSLRDWLVSQRITLTFLPTPLAESVMFLEWPATTSLRFLLTGADALHHRPPSNLPFPLINNYGPTETTVVATSGRVAPALLAHGVPSIGRPIANTQTYILDGHLHQLPAGMTGELYIGGAGVAKGYLNRPELTAERFIPDPFSDEPDARLYKTGDLAQYLTDGQIAFIGRSDHQIKIRGYRIEPGEIEYVLNQHPAIQKCVVVAIEDILEGKRLVAYIVLAPGAHTTTSALHDSLKKYLLDYMIPTVFVVLEAFPLTLNGKLDRVALPVPNATNTLGDGTTSAPRSPLEKQLNGMITTLLKVDRVGLDDNFFMLGGHSLLGTQLIARLAEAFDIKLKLRALFEAPTIRLLASKVERQIIERLETMSDEGALRLLEQRPDT